MAKPHVIVRRKDLKKYIPYGHTQLDNLIQRGRLKVVKLSENGRAVGISLASIIEYQRRVMGLEPIDDNGPAGAG